MAVFSFWMVVAFTGLIGVVLIVWLVLVAAGLRGVKENDGV
jgi:hypothetical protein